MSDSWVQEYVLPALVGPMAYACGINHGSTPPARHSGIQVQGHPWCTIASGPAQLNL